jgi:uncharacterized protein YjiS (DUF1127 family)
MADLLRADAEGHAARIDADAAFPVGLPRRARLLAVLAAGLAAALFLPEIDIAGWGAARRRRASDAEALRSASAAAERTFRSLSEQASAGEPLRSTEALRRMEDELRALLDAGASREDAKDAAAELESALSRARRAHEDAPASDGASRTVRERRLLAQAERAFEHWRRSIEGKSVAEPPIAPEGQQEAGTPAFIKLQDDVPRPKPGDVPIQRWIEAEAAAAAAVVSGGVPRPYREVVRRYFSRDAR